MPPVPTAVTGAPDVPRDRAAAEARVESIKAELRRLAASDAAAHLRIVEAQAELDRRIQERAEVGAAIARAGAELDLAIVAPVVGGEDPTLWLPDELLVAILIKVDAVPTCTAVCRRWRALCREPALRQLGWRARWNDYATGSRSPLHLPHARGTIVSVRGNYGCSSIGQSTVSVWRTDRPERVREIDAKTSYVTALAVATDGTVFTAGTSYMIWAWAAKVTGDSGGNGENAGQGKGEGCLRGFSGHYSTVMALDVGETALVSGSLDETVRVWDLDTGTLRWTLTGHTGDVRAVAVVSSDLVCSGSDDTTVRVWSLDTGAHLRTLEGHTDEVRDLCAGPRGTIASASLDTTVRVWDVASGRQLRVLHHPCAVTCLAVNNDGVIFTGASRVIRVWLNRNVTPRPWHEVDRSSAICRLDTTGGSLYSAQASRAIERF